MNWVEILVLALTIVFVIGIFSLQYYLKRKGRPSLASDCDCKGKGRALLKEYWAEKNKEEDNSCPHCHEHP
jgi:hypothetical protein